MPRILSHAVLSLLLLTACSGGGSDNSAFLAADAFGIGFQIDPGASGPAVALAAPGAVGTQGREQILREVAEADIFQIDGDTAYLLNTWRGLAIVDLAHLELRARLPLGGRPVEMYRRGSRAFVVVSVPGQGTAVQEIDVADPSAPARVASLPVDGESRTSRRVGDVLYVVTDLGAASFDLAQSPLAPSSSIGFATGADFVHATDDRMFVVRNLASSVHVLLIEISDPHGGMQLRGQLTLPGIMSDDKKLDGRGSVLRAVTQDLTNLALSHLFTVDFANPDAPAILATLSLAPGEQLFGTEFTATRAYIVTFERIDPLWVVDLSDPRAPFIAGELQTPGYSTQIVADGDQLVAYGVDPTPGGGNIVSLFDVADPTHPSLLARTAFGDYPSQALYDRKSFHVFADTVLVPTWNGVAVIDRSANHLQLRGIAPLNGGALRAFPHGGELCAFGDEELVAIDRQSLLQRGSVTLASNVVDVAQKSDGTELDLIQRGDHVELAGVTLPLYAEGMHVSGDRAAVIGWTDQGRAAYVVDCSTAPATASARIDLPWGGFACPAAPASMRMGAPFATAQAGFIAPFPLGPDSVLTATGKLVLRGLPAHAGHQLGSGDLSDGLVVLDIPTAALLPGVEVRAGAITGFVADGDGVAFTIGRFVRNDSERRPLLRHELIRLDFASNTARTVGNLPGYLVALDGNTAYAVLDRWEQNWTTTCQLNACDITASPSLLSSLPLPSYAYDFRAADGTLCYASGSNAWSTNPVQSNWQMPWGGPWQADYRIDSVHLARNLVPGPSLAGGDVYRAILRVEHDAVLLARDGFVVERWNLAGAAAVLDFTATVGGYASRIYPDHANAGHYLLPLGYAGVASVP